jgi:putative ABC transport system ATP-binding protein
VVACGLSAGDRERPDGDPGASGAEVTLTGLVVPGGERSSRGPAAAISLAVSRGQSVALHAAEDHTAIDLLDVVAGLQRPRRGVVTVGGVAVHRLSGQAMERYRRQRGLLSSRFPLLPSLSVTENVLVGLRSQRAGGAPGRAVAAELLAATGATSLASRRVETLSAEERWRVLIARALLPAPWLVLAEDPPSGLTARSAARVLDVLMDAHARLGFTLLLATDRLATAVRCERLVSLEGGTVIQDELTGDDAWTRGRVDRIG